MMDLRVVELVREVERDAEAMLHRHDPQPAWDTVPVRRPALRRLVSGRARTLMASLVSMF